MEDLNDGSPRQTAGEGTSSPDSRQSDVRFQRRVAVVSSPALAAARLTLPGVMDAEGRVDESRLRMHIFKNGTSIYLSMKKLKEQLYPLFSNWACAKDMQLHIQS